MSKDFLYPMAAQALFTIAYGLFMFFVRVSSVRSKQTKLKYFAYNTGEASELVLKTGQHFTNLFEVPVLFYAACLAFLSLDAFHATALVFAWVFFASRLAHAFVHTTHNRILPRLVAFMVGVLSVTSMWICLLLEVARP